MRQINVGCIGLGWIGRIRAQTCAAHPLVKDLRLSDLRLELLAELNALTGAQKATAEYRDLLAAPDLDAVIISTAPESTHYPIARDCLLAGKHVLLEKPMAMELHEADELVDIARRNNLKFTIAYTQRFNPKLVYVKQCVSNGTLGEPVTALVNRNAGRSIGKITTARTGLSLAMMCATHDLDFVFWCLEPHKPVRVYSQGVSRIMRPGDAQWLMVTMDDGVTFVIGASHIRPTPGTAPCTTTWIEFMGTKGSLYVDDTHREVTLSTVDGGLVHPMASMPGEQVEHVFAGPMVSETQHFIEAVAYDRPLLVSPEHARMVMEVCVAADISAERNEPVALPLPESRDGRLVA